MSRAELLEALDAAVPVALPGNGTRPAPAQGVAHAVMRRLSDIAPEAVTWLWPGRLPAGKLSLLAGDPGLGKSLITMTMAAHVSTGRPWPDGAPCELGGVVILSAEDDAGDTIRPRLDAAGGDPARVIVLDAVRRGDTERGIDLGHDLDAITEAIEAAPPCRLVIIDPITAYCGAVDANDNARVRGMLAPLVRLAATHGLAVVAVTHLRKGAGRALYRAIGSLGFAATARAAWGVARDPADKHRRLMLPMKMNLAADTGGLAYVIEERDGQPVLGWAPDPIKGVDVEAAMGGEASARSSHRGPWLEDASDWLAAALKDGPRSTVEIEAEAKDEGISKRTLERARKALGVRAGREGGGEGRWMLYPLASGIP